MTVEPGERIGLIGPNGSGKTSLLRILATLQRPTTGDAYVLGARVGTDEVYPIRSSIVLIGHQPGLYPELTLLENLEAVAQFTNTESNGVDARRALELVGLGGAVDRRAEYASKGMLRRAELARALVAEPTLLLMDEAHAGLDSEAAGLVEALAERVAGRGGGAVLVSHDPDKLQVDRLIRLVDGMTEVEA